MFSVKFWTDKLPEQGSFVCQPNGQIDLSNQPGTSQALAQRVEKLIQNLQTQGTLPFVLECLEELKSYRIRVVTDPFLHNLTCLFQQVQKKNTPDNCVDENGRKRLLSPHDPEGSVRQKLSSDKNLTQAAKLEKESEAVMRSIAWDLKEQLVQKKLGRIYSYAECCQMVKPDVTIVIGDKKFPAHRSLLCYYPYWANLFQSGMVDSNGTILVEQIDPEDFARLLEWLYTGRFEWENEPEAGSCGVTIRCAMINNLVMLERLLSIANQYQLASLERYIKELQTSLSKGFANPRSAFFLQDKPPDTFDKPTSESLFCDAHFKIHNKLFSCNRVVLACQSRYFRLLLDQHQDKGTKDNPIVLDPAVPSDFFGHLMGMIPTMEQKWLNEENVFTILQIADIEMRSGIAKVCCEFIRCHSILSKLSAKDPFRFRIVHIDSKMSKDDLKNLLKTHGREVRDLDLCQFHSSVDDDLIGCVAKFCPYLLRLNLPNAEVVIDGGIIQLAKNCTQLQCLNFCNTPVGDAAAEALAQSCPQLQYINLDGTNVTDAGIIVLAKSCSQLEAIILNECAVTNTSIIEVAKGCPHLQYLGLINTEVTDAGIIEIAMRCPQLRYFQSQNNCTDAGVIALALGCPNLQHVELNCSNVSDLGIIVVARNCSNLQDLELDSTQVSDVSLIEVAKSLPQLQSLSLYQCQGVTDASIDKVQKSCLQLRHLFVTSTNVTPECHAALKQHLQQQNLVLQSTNVRNDGIFSPPDGFFNRS